MDMADLRDSPVFIAGHPKSGTSLLRSVLDSHPELVAYPEETNFFRRYLPKATGADLPHKLALSDQYLTHIFEWNQVDPPTHQAGYPDRDYSYIPVAQVRQLVRQYVTQRFSHDGDMLSAVILAFGKVSGQLTELSQHWVEKTPYNERYAAQIFKWWPASRVVHTVRDPRDNFASYHRKHADWSPEAFALNWLQSTQAGLDNRQLYGTDRYLLLRFEDLTSTPEMKLSQLCQFLSINDDPSLRQPVRGGKPWGGNSMFADQFSAISAAPVGRWTETLQPDEVATLELIAGPVMQQLDYPLLGNLAALDRSARRLVLRRMLSLTRAARSAPDRLILQKALHNLSPACKTANAASPSRVGNMPSWQLFTGFSYLWMKERFRK
jgi:hypothetical protein